jgi:hypothetical protein
MTFSGIFSKRMRFVQPDGTLTLDARGWLSKFTGRIGPAIRDVPPDAGLPEIGQTLNLIIAECIAQGWIKRGSEAETQQLTNAIQAVCLIPAATEWGYAPYEVLRDADESRAAGPSGFLETENAWSQYARAGANSGPDLARVTLSQAQRAGRIGNPKCDWRQSIDNLEARLPNCKTVSLFVSWFGDDLRCGECNIYPGVTRSYETEYPRKWRCTGLTRGATRSLQSIDFKVVYGGTPDDQSLIDAIRDLRKRGIGTAFTPFLLLDIIGGNGRQDPYTGGPDQPLLPWRGRITKAFGTTDKTSAVADEVDRFAAKYRRFILHYADLCARAGGVEIFVLGTELRGLTYLRSAPGVYPFVNFLKTLAAEVRAILPNAKITYSADWSEYFGHQPGDGSGDVYFHLDDLWSDPNIDAIGIDNYFPITDWRDGTEHLDYVEGREIYSYDYMFENIAGGEGYDYFYANQDDRDSQTRTPITDGSGKPWVFRYKDLWSWWSNLHYNRPLGVEETTPTSWVPESKPIWFMELGIPSIDKGTNQPNVFYDPRSSESFFPYYSSGEPDTLILRRGIYAWHRFLTETDPEFNESNNPQSSVYSGRMVDVSKIFVYTWDARPFPFFPLLDYVWSDRGNYKFGHWIDGKLSSFAPPKLGDAMPLRTTYAPRHPFIVDPVTGKLDKQWEDFFLAIEYVEAEPVPNLSVEPTLAEVRAAVNTLLAILRAQKRIAS